MFVLLIVVETSLVSALFLLAYVKDIMLYRTMNIVWSAPIQLGREMSA